MVTDPDPVSTQIITAHGDERSFDFQECAGYYRRPFERPGPGYLPKTVKGRFYSLSLPDKAGTLASISAGDHPSASVLNHDLWRSVASVVKCSCRRLRACDRRR